MFYCHKLLASIGEFKGFEENLLNMQFDLWLSMNIWYPFATVAITKQNCVHIFKSSHDHEL